MSKILCTGGAGFVGSHLVDRLVKDGHDVTVVDNLSTGSLDNLEFEKVSFINVDISKRVSFPKSVAYKSFDYIYHLAAQINLRESLKDPVVDAKTNIMGSLNVIELAKKKKAKLIFASTGGAIYSPHASLPWTEFAEADPQSPYGLAKLTVEKYLKISDIPYCILRLSNVFGPRQNSKSEAGVISIFINKALEGSPLTIFGDGQQSRDFIYVSDVVEAFVLAQTKAGMLNVSSGEETTVLEIVELIKNEMGRELQVVHQDAIVGELRTSWLDNMALRSHGWNKQVSLKDGIKRTVEYFAK
jgi:UDP-glucose 4-epimerase